MNKPFKIISQLAQVFGYQFGIDSNSILLEKEGTDSIKVNINLDYTFDVIHPKLSQIRCNKNQVTGVVADMITATDISLIGKKTLHLSTEDVLKCKEGNNLLQSIKKASNENLKPKMEFVSNQYFVQAKGGLLIVWLDYAYEDYFPAIVELNELLLKD